MADELPSAPPVEAPPRKLGVGFGIGMTIFVVLGGVVSMFLMLPLAMASDPCGQGDPEFRCSMTGQQLLPWLPWMALVVGLIVAGIGASFLRKWEAAPASGLFSAGVIYVVTVCVALGYAGGGDAPQPVITQQQINADYQHLMQRPDLETMLSRYKALIPGIESQVPAIDWYPAIDMGPEPCGSDFAAIASVNPYGTQDAESSGLVLNGTGMFDKASWQQSVAALTTYLTAHGFTAEPDTDPYLPSATYHDQYGTKVNMGMDPTGINLNVGCFLTSAAKQRGTPPTGP